MSEEILWPLDLFDEVATYDPTSLGRRRLSKLVRRLRPDAVVCLCRTERRRLSLFRDWLFFRRLGVRRLYGFRPGRPILWKHAARRGSLPSQVDWLLAKLRLDGLPVSAEVRFELPVSEEDVRLVGSLWQEWGLERHDGPVVVVCAGSKMPAKRWPEERYAELGRRLVAEVGCFLVAVGGPDERELAERLVRAWGGGGVASGRTGYMASAELLRRSDLYVGNDTGAMHLAAAVGTRCVAIFSARDAPGVWDPYGCGHAVLRRRVPCEFCELKECKTSGHPCLNAIEVADALEACCSVLTEVSATCAE